MSIYLGTTPVADGASTALLADKADVDLTNVNASGTSLASGWSMPSSRVTALTVLASGSTYTAPANGWFAVLQVQSNTGYCNMYSNSGIGFMYYGSAGMPLKASIPVKKGDVVTYGYTNVSSVEFLYFIYAEGENV